MGAGQNILSVTRTSKGPIPILRWAGGKQRLLKTLADALPDDMDGRIYYEPFLGAASLFITIGPAASRLSDLNPHLIACYKQLRARPKAVARALRGHATRDSESYYYRVRKAYNRGAKGPNQAARFIYLNRTCFNGIFRVNRKGDFNVPYGYKNNPIFPDREQLVAVARKLKTSRLSVGCFRQSLRAAGKRAFVYLDPPYPPLNGTAYFTHYTTDRFSEKDQKDLALISKRLDAKGALFMMSNADTPLIRRLYKGFRMRQIPVTRFVTCSSHKHKVHELVITNY